MVGSYHRLAQVFLQLLEYRERPQIGSQQAQCIGIWRVHLSGQPVHRLGRYKIDRSGVIYAGCLNGNHLEAIVLEGLFDQAQPVFWVVADHGNRARPRCSQCFFDSTGRSRRGNSGPLGGILLPLVRVYQAGGHTSVADGIHATSVKGIQSFAIDILVLAIPGGTSEGQFGEMKRHTIRHNMPQLWFYYCVV